MSETERDSILKQELSKTQIKLVAQLWTARQMQQAVEEAKDDLPDEESNIGEVLQASLAIAERSLGNRLNVPYSLEDIINWVKDGK